MPELYRDRNWRITMYADDHLPPHFHVQCPDGEVQVDIETLALLAPGAVRKALKNALSEAREWARLNHDTLRAEWVRLNQRNA